MKDPYLIAIMGPTASGKSYLAEILAQKIDAQLINADAFQIYRGMDIGTNKPNKKELYQLIDIKYPKESFGVGEWIQRVHPILENLWHQKKNVIIVGGTGLYIRALFEQWQDLEPAPSDILREELNQQISETSLEELYKKIKILDPQVASTIDSQNPHRVRRALEKLLNPQIKIKNVLPPFKQRKLAILMPTERQNQLIEERTHHLLNSGWIEEVENLVKIGVTKDSPGMRAIGYRTVLDLLNKQITYSEASNIVQILTKQYAKRQRTWLRSEQCLEKVEIEGPSQINEELISLLINEYL